MRSIKLTIRNDPADLSVLRETLDRFGAEQGIPGKALFALQVVLDEIVSNVIKYAWPEGGAHEVLVRLAADDTAVRIEVVDDGRPYDPREAPAPAQAAPGSRPRPGGVGIHMVKQLVDGFEYERVDEYNCVRLTKRCIVGARSQTEGPNDKRRA
ncbi:serine/threonine-protein kinase RsbW/sigma-B regulation protein RsbU (phosphoserine phosphatase) [Rhizobiales bacterium GAS191]|nr:serine/threonine-protein kinase RsbW/sigma-B regulation protein RsbU (phosphoserine phosphatase) [Rhizobiales bacterium GAS191]